MHFKHIDKSLEPEWEKLVQSGQGSGFMQSFFWSSFKQKTGWDTFKIGIFIEDELVSGAVVMKFPFSTKKNFLYIPEGPIFPDDQRESAEFFHSLVGEIDQIADLKGKELTTHLRIEPRIHDVPLYFDRFRKAPFNMEPKNTLMIDLTQTEEQILAQMKPKGRYNIKIADRNNVRISYDDSKTAVEKFLKLYAETAVRDRFEGKDERYFQILIPHVLEWNKGKVFFAEVDGETVATALVIFYGNRATYFFGASGNHFREKMAPYKLHWEIIRYAKNQGYVWYDFWGIAPENADLSHEWLGFTQFKKKFGGQVFDFIGAYDFVYNEKLYQEFLLESGETKK